MRGLTKLIRPRKASHTDKVLASTKMHSSRYAEYLFEIWASSRQYSAKREMSLFRCRMWRVICNCLSSIPLYWSIDKFGKYSAERLKILLPTSGTAMRKLLDCWRRLRVWWSKKHYTHWLPNPVAEESVGQKRYWLECRTTVVARLSWFLEWRM